MRTRSLAWSELKLGIVGVLAIVLTTAIVLAVGGQGGFFWQRYPLRVQFDDVYGLKRGAVVRLNGMEVGKVTGIRFVGAAVEVDLTVTKRVRPLITHESRASIGSLSLLGEPIVTISSPAPGVALEDGAFVPTGRGGGVNALAKTAADGIADVSELITTVREGRGTLGHLLADDSLYIELHRLAASARRSAEQLERGRGTLGSLLHEDDALSSVNELLRDLHAISARIRSGTGPLGRLVADDSLARATASTLDHLERVSGRIARGEGTAGRLLADDEMYERLDSLTAGLERVLGGLEAGQGSAGRLLQDQQLYENVNLAAVELRQLLADVRRDPRRYLSVRLW